MFRRQTAVLVAPDAIRLGGKTGLPVPFHDWKWQKRALVRDAPLTIRMANECVSV